MIDDVVERDAFGAAYHHPNLQVILQVVPDAGGIEHDLDAMLSQ
jgi:hypothetical protein